MRKTSIVVIPLTLLLVLAVTAGRGSSASQEEPLARVVAALRGQVDELSTRMERLEQLIDRSYGRGLSLIGVLIGGGLVAALVYRLLIARLTAPRGGQPS